MLSRTSGKLLRTDTWKRWVLKQRLNYVKLRIREAVLKHTWKRWVLDIKQGLNYVKSRIREAASQAHMEEVGA